MKLMDKIENRKKIAEKRKAARELCINTVAEDLKISFQEAEKIVDDGMARMKMPYTHFRKGEFWKIPVEKQPAAYEAYLVKKAETDEKKDALIKAVCEQSGWKYDTAKAKMQEAGENFGCRYDEYYKYSFWNKDEQLQREYFLRDESHKICDKFDNKLVEEVVKNKSIADTLFSKYMRRKWCLNRGITLDEFKHKFRHAKKIVYKPLKGIQGIGVEVYEFSPESAEDVYKEVTEKPKGIVEEFIYQHPEMQRLNPSSVNTIRFVTVSWTDNHELHVDMPYATARIGNGAMVDNMHSGGMGAAIDLDTGIICTAGGDSQCNVYEVHPATNVPIKGFKIPMFAEAKEFVENIIKEYTLTGYIGWDIAVTRKGPMLIELNTNPSSDILQIPYAGMNKGMRYVMEKYLD